MFVPYFNPVNFTVDGMIVIGQSPKMLVIFFKLVDLLVKLGKIFPKFMRHMAHSRPPMVNSQIDPNGAAHLLI